MAAMGVSVMMMMMMMMIMGAAAQAPAPAVDCQSVILTTADCLTFVTGGAKTPPATCCSELKAVIDSTPQCLCLLFNATFTEPLGVNITLAQQLPPLCKLQTPPTSLCSAFGVPVPGPVSPVATSPAIAPASAKTPTTAPAPGAMAVAPVSPSPSSMTSPASSPASMMSPASTPTSMSAPTGSIAGTTPSNGSTLAPGPSGAPSITSQNAAVAASILFLASIFLS